MPHLLRLLLVLFLSFTLGDRPQAGGDGCCPDPSAATVEAPLAPTLAGAHPGCAVAGNDAGGACTSDCLATCSCCQPVVAVQGTTRAPRFASPVARTRLPGAATPPHIDPKGLLQVPKAA